MIYIDKETTRIKESKNTGIKWRETLTHHNAYELINTWSKE